MFTALHSNQLSNYNNQPLSVLIVDDSRLSQAVLARHLQRHHVTVEKANSGTEALSHLMQKSYDLIFLDLHMPNINGFQLLQCLADNPQWIHIPIIIISSLSELTHHFSPSANKQNVWLLPKPFNAEKIDKYIQQIKSNKKNCS
ncbi:MAG TPA: response regulator [Anaerolineae bacterium]|nr:response regulator [Anaerolineae bacterium]